MDIECQLDCGSYGVFLTTELALTQQIPIYQSIHTQTRAMCLMLAMAGPLHGPHPKSESNSSWQYLRKQTNQSQLKMETLRCVCNVYQYLENFFSSLILFIRFICFCQFIRREKNKQQQEHMYKE